MIINNKNHFQIYSIYHYGIDFFLAKRERGSWYFPSPPWFDCPPECVVCLALGRSKGHHGHMSELHSIMGMIYSPLAHHNFILKLNIWHQLLRNLPKPTGMHLHHHNKWPIQDFICAFQTHNTILVSDGTLKIETEDIVKEHYLKLQHTSVGHSSLLPSSGLGRFLHICFWVMYRWYSDNKTHLSPHVWMVVYIILFVMKDAS